MPLRPRSHDIEDESEDAFRRAIPRKWVARRLVPDYGIDLTVQVFDADGHSTPHSFHVQLKATDVSDTADALRGVRFRRELAEHYWSLPIPVLVVRYHAPHERLYARWFHAYNALVATRGGDGEEVSKTVGFPFSEADAWTADTPRALVAGVDAFRRFRSAELPLPITFAVSSAELDGELVPMVLALRSQLEPVQHIAGVRSDQPGPDRPHIVLGSRSTSIALADVASVTLDHADGRGDRAVAAANITTGMALLLARVGQVNLAAQIAAACAASSSVIENLDVAFTLAGAMYRSQRIPEALQLTADLNMRGDEDARLAAFVLQSAVLARGGQLSEEETRRAVTVAEAALEARLASGAGRGVAADAYNLGMARRRANDPAGAVEAFEQAARIDPSYEERLYFNRDLAGVLFGSHQYDHSAERYRRALDLGADESVRALCADALLFAGRYEEALAQFSRYLQDGGAPEDAEWRIKLRILPLVLEVAGNPRQTRDREGAIASIEAIDLFDPSLDAHTARSAIRTALRLDACCGIAYNRMMFLSAIEHPDGSIDFSDALDPAIAAAAFQEGSAADWTNAIRAASALRAPRSLVYDLARSGIRLAGRGLISDLLTDVEEPLTAEALSAIESASEDEAVEANRSSFTLRVPDGDGNMTEFDFGSPPDGDADPHSWTPTSDQES